LCSDQQQLEIFQSNPSPAELAGKTIDYAVAKEAYFKALRAETPELLKIATGREARPADAGHFAAAFALAGEKSRRWLRTKRAWFAKTILAQSRR
jgi:hypothetical protein